MKKRIKKIIFGNKAQNFYQHLAEWIVCAAIGAIGSLLFGRPLIGIICFSVFGLIAIIYLYVINRAEDEWNIVKIMQIELKANNNIQVIRMGYPLSRPLHLSGRRSLRMKIGNIVKQSCENLISTNVHTVEIDGKNISVKRILSGILIDDLGWSAYEMQKTDFAKDNIQNGIKLALEDDENKLALKGYRHLVGIYDDEQDTTKRENAIKEGYKIIQQNSFKTSMSSNEYEHIVAEYDYAIAKTLIEEETEKALVMAKRVQNVFSTGSIRDNDRYAKTFDLIGDIYATYNSPSKMKLAKDTYIEGIKKCQEYGRSERLLRISIDYISLLIKMLEVNKKVYDIESWNAIDDEELEKYNISIQCATNIEDHAIKTELRRIHKKYLKTRKQYNKRK